MTELTNHGAQRARERVGLNRRSADRLATRAWERGLAAENCSGPLRRYLDGCGMAHHTTPRVWGQHVYMFGRSPEEGGLPMLITVLYLPHELRKAASKLLKARSR